MKTIRTIIIDDEQNNISALEVLLKNFEEIEMVGSANGPLKGAKIIADLAPDLVLLDVEMPQGTGFELLELFPDRQFKVVFVTAHEEYALPAIKEHAFDYIVKPVDEDKIAALVGKLTKKTHEDIKPANLSKIIVNTQTDTYFIPKERIIRVEGSGNYSIFYLKGGAPITSSKNLKSTLDDLSDDIFFKSHKSHIVNLLSVDRLKKSDGDLIVMQDGSEVPLSRRRKDEFLLRFG